MTRPTGPGISPSHVVARASVRVAPAGFEATTAIPILPAQRLGVQVEPRSALQPCQKSLSNRCSGSAGGIRGNTGIEFIERQSIVS
jgi:hypothetical protein